MCNKLLIESAAASQNIIIQMLHRVAKVVARFENCECQCFIIVQASSISLKFLAQVTELVPLQLKVLYSSSLFF